MLLSLLLRMTTPGPGPLTLLNSLPLPVYAETAAWAVPLGDELRLFINRPGRADTAQVRVNARLQLTELPAVPLVVGGAAACGHDVVLTGADAAGHSHAAVVGADGKVVRRAAVKAGAMAAAFPGCLSRPVVLVQEQ